MLYFLLLMFLIKQCYNFMYQQAQNSRLSNLGHKFINSNYQSQQLPNRKFHQLTELRKRKLQTQPAHFDSLQAFQEQLNSVLSSSTNKNKVHKNKIVRPRQQFKSQQATSLPPQQAYELKKQVNQIKSILKSQTQRLNIQQKLQQIIVQLQVQKQKQRLQIKTSRQETQYLKTPLSHNSVSNPSPYMMSQQPQIIYSPQPYFTPFNMYPSPFPQYHRRSRRQYDRQNQEDESQDDNDDRRSRNYSRKGKNYRSRVQSKPQHKKTGLDKKYRFSKLRVYFFAVAFSIFYKKQAKRKAKIRKMSVQKFWTQKFDNQASLIKNWLLQSQKLAIPLIIQKKNLSMIYFKQKSKKVKQQKQELIKRIVFIGVNQLEKLTTPTNVSQFIQTLCIFCQDKSFAVDYLWTSSQLSQINFSVPLGFFKIDKNQQKYLIILLILVKIFIFNMFLQPYKFDCKNFSKNSQPLSTNMKLISSVYYHMVKQIINQYTKSDPNKSTSKKNNFKRGNWKQIQKGITVVCSQPLTLQKRPTQEGQYINGLYKYEELEELGEEQFWNVCIKKLKNIVEILHGLMKQRSKKSQK